MTDTEPCGCPDYSMTRRSLLRAAGLASAAGVVTSMTGGALTSTVFGSTDANVLVVLSLRGGADGLSMVVPHAEPAYHAARPSTAIKATQVLHRDDTFGLHPAFAPLSPWWKRGELAAAHAIGLPAPNRSHFEAMEIVEDADPGSAERIGWINRMISGLAGQTDVMRGLQLGNTTMPTSLLGPAPALATGRLDDLTMPMHEDRRITGVLDEAWRRQYGGRKDVLGRAASEALALSKRSATIGSAIERKPANGATYARYSEAGAALAHGAALIKAGVGVRALAVDAGGWDHHAGLRWNVESTIGTLATDLAAFFTDLGPHASRVTLITLSEFGRRLQENGSAGVDHGYGNCVLLMGAGVRGGRYYGRWPGLGEAQQVDGDLAVTTDYRSLLGEVLAARFPEVDLSRVFPGVARDPLGVMR